MNRRPISRKQHTGTPDSPPPEKRGLTRRAGIIIATIVVVAVGATIGISYYVTQVMPFQRTIIQIDDRSFSIDYFVRRLFSSEGANNFEMLDTIVREEIVRMDAPLLVDDVTQDEVDETLLDAARGENETISDAEYKAWYRDQLNETKLSRAQFDELVYTYLLMERLYEYLLERTPTVAEQVHLYALSFESIDEAEEAEARLKEGESFDAVAMDVLGEDYSEENYDAGWWPLDALGIVSGTSLVTPPEVVFTQAAGEENSLLTLVSQDPVVFAIFMVAEGPSSREIEEYTLSIVQSQQFENWVYTQIGLHEVTFHGLSNGAFDDETYNWINWQLSRLARE